MGKSREEGQNDTNLNVVLPLKTSLFISRLVASDPHRSCRDMSDTQVQLSRRVFPDDEGDDAIVKER
jgi:hypothetical protein